MLSLENLCSLFPSLNVLQVNASIGMNVVSSIFSLLGIIIIIMDLCFSRSQNGSLMVSITAD